MKNKILSLILALVLIFCVFAGCSKSQDNDAEDTTVQTSSETNQIDVDLTQLSSTMVYSEVYNMLITPDNYRGKTVKMEGQFSSAASADNSKYYYAVIIADATACCQQGIEFVLADGKTPEHEIGDEITVVGTFDTYQEGELTYCYLKNAVEV